MTAPAPAVISRSSSPESPQAWLGTSMEVRSWQARTPSRPVGASTRTRCSRAERSGTEDFLRHLSVVPASHQRLALAPVLQSAGEDAVELPQLPADLHAVVGGAQLPHVAFVIAGAPLDDRHRLAHLAEGLEVAQQHH